MSTHALPHIPVPDPLPEPLPSGGPQTGYQFQFNKRYYKTRIDALKPFSYGLAASEFPGSTQLTEEQLTDLANTLYDWVPPGGPGAYGPKHVDFDEQIEYWRQDPYATMYMRLRNYGYERVPVGTGATSQPPNVVTPDELHGPPIKGKYLLVTLDANKL